MLYDLSAARTEEQRAYMERLEREGVCIFCPGHIRQPVLFSGEHWFATVNAFPYAGVVAHYLLIPHRHVAAFAELPDAAGAELWAFRRRLAERHPGADATASVERSGDMRCNGGSVEHLHTHFVILGGAPERTVRFRVSAHAPD